VTNVGNGEIEMEKMEEMGMKIVYQIHCISHAGV
jgi:hypothetical protein